MNCEQARDLAALAASGDLNGAEQSALEVHVAGCGECLAEANAFEELRARLTEMRAESAPEYVYAAVRARVAGEIVSRRRTAWLAAWPALVAVLACSVMLVVLLHPEVPPATQQSAVQTPETAAAIIEAQSGGQVEPPAAAPAEPRRSARRPVRRVVPAEPEQPVIVHMLTDDPDVVIYWIADAKRTRTEKGTMQ